MRMMILAYNPNHVKAEVMFNLVAIMLNEFGCRVYLVEHYDATSDPLYCVQFADTPQVKFRNEFVFDPPKVP
jgi:hypothetical protein